MAGGGVAGGPTNYERRGQDAIQSHLRASRIQRDCIAAYEELVGVVPVAWARPLGQVL